MIRPGRIPNAPELPHHTSEITWWFMEHQTLHVLLCREFQELLQLLTIDWLFNSISRILYLNCTIRKCMSNNKRTRPVGPKLTWKEVQSLIIYEHFHACGKVLPKNYLIMNQLRPLLRQSSILISLRSDLL